MEELNTILADLARGGALDSTGVFTLSLQSAEEKLAAYRLANPGLFVLNLVAAAVSSGATVFSVETFENQTDFSFDPKICHQDHDLRQIFSYILDPSAPPYLRELALALHGARALPESPAISLQVTVGDLSHVLTVTSDGVAVAPGSKGPAGLTFRLTYQSTGAWTALFARRQDKNQDVLQHLFHFCRHAPLRITSNGQTKGSAVHFGTERYKAIFAWRHVEGQQALPVVSASGHYSRPEAFHQGRPLSTLVVGLAPRKVAQANGLVLVSRGVAFRRSADLLGFPLACAVVTADHLEKNLSQSDLVEGPEYEKLIQTVRAEIRDLVLAICGQPPAWPSMAVADSFAVALDLHFASEQAPAVETFRRLRAIEVSCRDADAQSEQMSYWRALLVRDPRQGEAFRQEMVTAVTRQATRRLVHAQWKEAALYLTDLYELKSQVPDALLAAVMVLTDQSNRARDLMSMAGAGNSPRLEYLLGWRDDLNGERPIVRFLRFLRAVDTDQVDTADALASALEDCSGTAFLYLWLGWYQVYRQRYQRTAGLWERAMSLVPVEERERWSNILYPEIAGKLTFLEQVRWQARRSLEGIQFSLGPTKKATILAGQTTHPARWAKNVWAHRIAGQKEAARELFVKGYLVAMINPRQLCLEPVDSPEISLAPFRP